MKIELDVPASIMPGRLLADLDKEYLIASDIKDKETRGRTLATIFALKAIVKRLLRIPTPFSLTIDLSYSGETYRYRVSEIDKK